MTDLFDLLPPMDRFVVPFVVAGVLFWIANLLLIVWRRRRGGPIHPPFTDRDVQFAEKRVSGRSHKNLFTKLAGASGVLEVTVLADGVLIEPFWIIKWALPAGVNDLEHYVSKSDILSVQPVSAPGNQAVLLEFRGRDGLTHTLELVLRKRDAFIAALSSPARPVPSA